jgi:predicted porin
MELVRGLNKHWSATLELTYSDGRTIAFPSNAGNSRVTTEEGLVGLLYRFTRDVALTAQYGRIRQPYAGQFSQTLQPDHNQVQAGLTYRFQKALSQ